MLVKSSFYNEIIPISETKESLLYNIISGGLSILDDDLSDFLLGKNGDPFFIDEHRPEAKNLIELYKEGFLVDSEIDEREAYHDNYIRNQKRKFSTSAHIGITIGTTILCNMGCPYCFEAVKPNKSLRDNKVILAIVEYIENVIQTAKVKKWASLGVTWYGGEPLLNQDAIQILSKKLIEMANKYSIPYDASMITNGILLTRETWQLLMDAKISSVQVTIDGGKETHDIYRPLKNSSLRNYEQILENLSMMPQEIQGTIRINTDKKVASTLDQLLDDLKLYGIWPQRHESFSVSLACLRSYAGADNSQMQFLTESEYFEVQEKFSRMKVERYNDWSRKNGGPKAKIKWRVPEKQSDCSTYVSPYFFVFDPEGTIHKCWETVHVSSKSTGSNVFKSWSPTDFEKYLKYSRTKVHPICYNCKFNPVCEGLSCAYDTLAQLDEDKFPCTPWKTMLGNYFKRMYLFNRSHPDEVSLGISQSDAHQTHANK